MLPDVVEQPVGNDLDVDLGAFLLQEALQAVVAVAFGGHRPELADHRDLGLDHGAIHFNVAQDAPRLDQRHRQTGHRDLGLQTQRVAHQRLDLLQRFVRRAFDLLVRAHPIANGIDGITDDDRHDHADEELGI